MEVEKRLLFWVEDKKEKNRSQKKWIFLEGEKVDDLINKFQK